MIGRFAPSFHKFLIFVNAGLWTSKVAQVSNLLYRRLPVGRPRLLAVSELSRQLADWKSARRQIGDLRYFSIAASPSYFDLE